MKMDALQRTGSDAASGVVGGFGVVASGRLVKRDNWRQCLELGTSRHLPQHQHENLQYVQRMPDLGCGMVARWVHGGEEALIVSFQSQTGPADEEGLELARDSHRPGQTRKPTEKHAQTRSLDERSFIVFWSPEMFPEMQRSGQNSGRAQMERRHGKGKKRSCKRQKRVQCASSLSASCAPGWGSC